MQIVVNQILIGLIAALGCLIGGTVMLPTLATDELREVLANIIQTSGYSISGYASRIFPPEQVQCPKLFHVEAAAHFPQTHKLATAVSGYASCTCRTCFMCLHVSKVCTAVWLTSCLTYGYTMVMAYTTCAIRTAKSSGNAADCLQEALFRRCRLVW